MIDLNALSLADLYAHLRESGLVAGVLRVARDEDVAAEPGVRPVDVTSELSVGADERCAVAVSLREPGRVAGLAALGDVIEVFGADVRLSLCAADGDVCDDGKVLARIEGRTRDVLAVERPLLNLLGRLCGIATHTAVFVREVGDAPVKVCDTRKTTPGLRVLEKYAVRCGGGWLHRVGLSDAVLIKDNHIAAMGDVSLVDALTRIGRTARERGGVRFVEVEVDTLDQFAKVLEVEAGLIDYALLDNMTVGELKEAVRMRAAVGSGIELEASGGVTLETIGAIARSGVHRISVGSLTHGARSVDVGLDWGDLA